MARCNLDKTKHIRTFKMAWWRVVYIATLDPCRILVCEPIWSQFNATLYVLRRLKYGEVFIGLKLSRISAVAPNRNCGRIIRIEVQIGTHLGASLEPRELLEIPCDVS